MMAQADSLCVRIHQSNKGYPKSALIVVWRPIGNCLYRKNRKPYSYLFYRMKLSCVSAETPAKLGKNPRTLHCFSFNESFRPMIPPYLELYHSNEPWRRAALQTVEMGPCRVSTKTQMPFSIRFINLVSAKDLEFCASKGFNLYVVCRSRFAKLSVCTDQDPRIATVETWHCRVSTKTRCRFLSGL